MATVFGNNATKILNTNPPAQANVGEQGGDVKLIYDKYTYSADLSLADIIKMGGLIPKGALIIDAFMKFSDLGSSSTGTLSFGYAASAELDSAGVALEAVAATAFISAVDVHTAADVIKASDNQAAPTGIGKRLLGAVQPIVTIAEDTDSTTGTIEVFILYTLT